ncbi:hypothetical protein BKA93DRAFT_752483 [Sparassis latifolia]
MFMQNENMIVNRTEIALSTIFGMVDPTDLQVEDSIVAHKGKEQTGAQIAGIPKRPRVSNPVLNKEAKITQLRIDKPVAKIQSFSPGKKVGKTPREFSGKARNKFNLFSIAIYTPACPSRPLSLVWQSARLRATVRCSEQALLRAGLRQAPACCRTRFRHPAVLYMERGPTTWSPECSKSYGKASDPTDWRRRRDG